MRSSLAASLLTITLTIGLADAVDAQTTRYESYGTELRRIPGYGTLDAPLYRGESDHAKTSRTPSAHWPSRASRYNHSRSWYDGRRYYHRR